jgi:wingless-type MMTV integration site family protein 16
MKMRCRCHGVSGSCGVKTCWRSVPPFREVGDQLKKKYENSVEISPRPAAVAAAASSIRLQHDSPYASLSSAAAAALRRREKRKRREPIADTELVFVDRSPNYCRPDPDRGVPGTKGRECRRGSYGPESCESLCCGRGFNVEEIRRVERCHCRFVWCCEVKCKSCETLEKRYTCK